MEKKNNNFGKIAYEIFYEDEIFFQELLSGLEEKEKRIILKIAHFGLDNLVKNKNNLSYEFIADAIRKEKGFKDDLLKIKNYLILLR